MSLYNKKWLGPLLAALFLPAAMTVHASASAAICAPDQYVLLSTGDCYADIFDCNGNMVGNCRVSIDQYTGAATVNKDSLLLFYNDETWTVYSMALLKNILEFPVSEYNVSCSSHACIVMDKATGSYCVYDCTGNLLYESQDVIPTNSEISFGQIYEIENGYIAGVCGYSEDTPVPPCSPVWIYPDTGEYRQITDPVLSQAFFAGRVAPFGSCFSIYDWESGTCSLYNTDGEIVLENVDTLIYPYIPISHSILYESRPVLALVRQDSSCLLYDSDLLLTAAFPASEVTYPEYADGYISGMRYEELEDRVCTEFVLCRNRSWCPAARTDDGLLVYQDGQLFRFPVNAEETVSGFNDTHYIVAGNDDIGDGGHYERLIERKTGAIVAESRWTEDHYTYFDLFEDYCLATEYRRLGEEYLSSCSIYGPDSTLLYQSDKSEARTWENGCIYLKRGIYHGIADAQGNWLIRTVASRDD